MLIEVVAYMGAVLSLKGDMLANENYLRTVKNRNNLKKLLELIGVDMKGPLGAAGGAVLETQETLTTGIGNNFPLSIKPEDRNFSITSKEDGAPVNYTLYLIEGNTIKDLDSELGTVLLQEADALNVNPTVFTNIAVVEGALSTQQGVFDTLEGNKRIDLTDSPIIEGSIQVYVNTPDADHAANGAYKQVDRLYSASGGTDRIFQAVYSEEYAATLLFGDNSLGISPPAGSTFTIL